MRNVLLVLHVMFAILLIGPLTLGALTTAAILRQGGDALPAVRWHFRVETALGPATALVVVTGLWLVALSDGFKVGQAWIVGALALYVVAAVNGAVFVAGATRAAIARLESGQSAAAETSRLAALGLFSVALDVTIVWLMVAKPGL